MKRKIIEIDQEKCNGCGLCVTACHEGAIAIINNKATLIRDDYCDGLGACLPACPVDALHFVEREAAPFDQQAVDKHLAQKTSCPSNQAQLLKKEPSSQNITTLDTPSQLQQWPVQIKLVPTNAPYFNNASLLIAADCTAYACADFHNRFMKNKITLIGCPKLDEGDYSEKLCEIIKHNNIKDITVVRMEVPCCTGILNATQTALKNSGKEINLQLIILKIK